MPLETIMRLTREYAARRAVLAERVQSLQEEMDALQRSKMRGIKAALATTQDAQAALENALKAEPELFEKPRTITVDGIKVGYAKGKGKLEWEDDARVVALIEKHFPEQADVLIAVEKKPVKDALNQLTVAELKKLGVTAEDVGDKIVIKAQDSAIEKLIKKLLKVDDSTAYDEIPH